MVWSCNTMEKFVMHIQQVIAAIKAKGLQENYEKLVLAKKECKEKHEEAVLVLNQDLIEGEVRDDPPSCMNGHRGSSEGEDCGRAHRQPDLPALLQLPLRRGKTALELLDSNNTK